MAARLAILAMRICLACLIVIYPFIRTLQLNHRSLNASATVENPLRLIEDQIKDQAVKELTTLHTRSLEFVAEVAGVNGPNPLVAPVATASFDETHLFVLENNLSRLYHVSFALASSPRTEEQHMSIQLEHPTVMKRLKETLFIWDDSGVHLTDSGGTVRKTIQSFYQVNDFAPMADGRMVLNPELRGGKTGPLVVEIDRSGKRDFSWGRQDLISFGGITGSANIGVCGTEVAAAMVYEPTLYLFSRVDSIGKRVLVSVPGVPALEALRGDKKLTNPRPGTYSLPTFFTGMACEEQAIFILVDLPVLTIYKLDLTGKITGIYTETNVHHARHFRRLEIEKYNGHLYFYTLATDMDGTRKVIIMKSS
jgi:hypothetical protein